MILNLTQHNATAEQKAQLVVEPRMTKEKIRKLLTFEEYKKAKLLEIEGLPYDKKYLRPPRAKWTL
jgi:hypothetical protein